MPVVAGASVSRRSRPAPRPPVSVDEAGHCCVARRYGASVWGSSRIGGAFHEDIGRVEVVFRNTVDQALDHRGSTRHWPTPWYLRAQLFTGRHGARAIKEIDAARRRARRSGRTEDRGRVIAELNFRFWRYLCTQPYLTSLWGLFANEGVGAIAGWGGRGLP